MRQEAGSSQAGEDTGDISELFGDIKVEAEPYVETWVARWIRSTMVEFSEFEPEEKPAPQLALPGPRATPTRKRTRAQTSKASKSFSAIQVDACRKKHKSLSK